jgi:hypothetical protein
MPSKIEKSLTLPKAYEEEQHQPGPIMIPGALNIIEDSASEGSESDPDHMVLK